MDAANTGLLVSQLIANLRATTGSLTDPDTNPLEGLAFSAPDQSHGAWQYSLDNAAHWSDFGSVSASITITSVNDAPVLSTTGTPTLAPIDEDSLPTANAGTLVSQILANFTATGGTYLDDNTAAPQGIAVTTLDTSHGTWQFSLNNGANWSTFGTTSASSAQLLASDSKTRIRFLPNTDFHGAANFSFVAWDQSSGTNGGTGIATNRGGSKPFSLVVKSASILVTTVNDPPLGTNKTVTFNEDSVYQFTATDFGFQDTNDSPPNTLRAVVISTLPAAGSLTLSSAPVIKGQVIPVANLVNLKLTPAPNANGSNYASFTFQVQDNGGTTDNGVDLDATPNTFTLNVTPVNDAPVLKPDGDPVLNSITEDLPVASNTGTLISQLIASMAPQGSITDVDAAAKQGIAIIGANQLSGTWQFSTNGTAWTNFGTPSIANALLLAADANTHVRFVPKANFTGSVGVTFIAWDQTSGTNGSFTAISASGGTSAFSTARDNAFITVTSA